MNLLWTKNELKMKDKVLITGATGATGQSAVRHLLERNIPVRAMVHKIDERSSALQKLGVEVVQGDLNDFDSVSNALEGISAAYFLYPIQVPGILEATAFFIQAALENGVNHIVNISQRTARRDAASHAAQNHWIAERLWDRSGLHITHLRPTLFAEWLSYVAQDIRENNRIVLPFGNGKYAPITADDQGRVIAAILSEPSKHAGKTYDLLGLEELSLSNIATILSEIIKREITYVPIEIEPFKEIMQQNPDFTPWFIQHVSAIAADVRNGITAGINDTVEDLTGFRPASIAHYITENKNLFL